MNVSKSRDFGKRLGKNREKSFDFLKEIIFVLNEWNIAKDSKHVII